MKNPGQTFCEIKPQRKSATLARPFVLLNMSMTADGKIATANRQVSTFSSPQDHEHLLKLRSASDAVMCGARTADLNEINLGPGALKYRRARLRAGLSEYNLRIVVSGSSSLDPAAAIFRHKFSPVLVLTTGCASKARLKALRAVADEVRVCGQSEINWPATLHWLRDKWQVKRLLCEGGGELNDSLFRAEVVDQLHLTICPVIIGGRNAPTLSEGIGFRSLAAASRFQFVSNKRCGAESFLVLNRESR